MRPIAEIHGSGHEIGLNHFKAFADSANGMNDYDRVVLTSTGLKLVPETRRKLGLLVTKAEGASLLHSRVTQNSMVNQKLRDLIDIQFKEYAMPKTLRARIDNFLLNLGMDQACDLNKKRLESILKEVGNFQKLCTCAQKRNRSLKDEFTKIVSNQHIGEDQTVYIDHAGHVRTASKNTNQESITLTRRKLVDALRLPCNFKEVNDNLDKVVLSEQNLTSPLTVGALRRIFSENKQQKAAIERRETKTMLIARLNFIQNDVLGGLQNRGESKVQFDKYISVFKGKIGECIKHLQDDRFHEAYDTLYLVCELYKIAFSGPEKPPVSRKETMRHLNAALSLADQLRKILLQRDKEIRTNANLNFSNSIKRLENEEINRLSTLASSVDSRRRFFKLVITAVNTQLNVFQSEYAKINFKTLEDGRKLAEIRLLLDRTNEILKSVCRQKELEGYLDELLKKEAGAYVEMLFSGSPSLKEYCLLRKMGYSSEVICKYKPKEHGTDTFLGCKGSKVKVFSKPFQADFTKKEITFAIKPILHPYFQKSAAYLNGISPEITNIMTSFAANKCAELLGAKHVLSQTHVTLVNSRPSLALEFAPGENLYEFVSTHNNDLKNDCKSKDQATKIQAERMSVELIAGLSDIMFVDMLTGEADRNCSNIRVLYDRENGRCLPMAIDNEQCFAPNIHGPNHIKVSQSRFYDMRQEAQQGKMPLGKFYRCFSIDSNDNERPYVLMPDHVQKDKYWKEVFAPNTCITSAKFPTCITHDTYAKIEKLKTAVEKWKMSSDAADPSMHPVVRVVLPYLCTQSKDYDKKSNAAIIARTDETIKQAIELKKKGMVIYNNNTTLGSDLKVVKKLAKKTLGEIPALADFAHQLANYLFS